MVTPISKKEWAEIKRDAKERASPRAYISGSYCMKCLASPCVSNCSMYYDLSQRNKNIPISSQTQSVKPRKTIPKKIRGIAWKIQFGDSTKGSCFCCKKELDVFDDWHAGHIVSHSNNGTDTADNLRPVCGSCNLSMGTENMDAFKARCYPN